MKKIEASVPPQVARKLYTADALAKYPNIQPNVLKASVEFTTSAHYPHGDGMWNKS